MTAPRRPRRRHIKITRDLVLFAGGLAGVFHETLWSNTDRPTLLVLFAGMLGLPVFLQQDEKRQGGGSIFGSRSSGEDEK